MIFFNRAAGQLLHELRHLTIANSEIIKGSGRNPNRAILSQQEHDSDLGEQDADRFEDIVMGRRRGIINDK